MTPKRRDALRLRENRGRPTFRAPMEPGPRPLNNISLPAGRRSRTERIKALIRGIQERRVSPADLPTAARRRIIQYIIETQPNATASAIGELVGLSTGQVHAVRRHLIKTAAWELDDLDVRQVAAELLSKKRHLQAAAVEKGDIATAWRIEMDTIEALQSLGFVSRTPQRVEVGLGEGLREIFDHCEQIPTAGEFLERLRGAFTPAGLLPAAAAPAEPDGQSEGGAADGPAAS